MKPDILMTRSLTPLLLKRNTDPRVLEVMDKKKWPFGRYIPVTLFGERYFKEDPENPGNPENSQEKYDFIFWAVLCDYYVKPEEPEPVASLRIPVFPFRSNEWLEVTLRKLQKDHGIDTLALESDNHGLYFHRLIQRGSGHLGRKRLEVRYVGNFEEGIGPRELLERSGRPEDKDLLDKIDRIDKIYG